MPIDESAGRLVTLFERYRPAVVITYDDQGGYDHPDHLQAHRVTVAAVEQSGIPAKLYLSAFRRRTFEKLRDKLAELGVEFPAPELDAETLALMDAVERRITTTVDTTAFVEQKQLALAAHASQVEVRFVVEGPTQTSVELEHRGFERHGVDAGAVLGSVDSQTGWTYCLDLFIKYLAA